MKRKIICQFLGPRNAVNDPLTERLFLQAIWLYFLSVVGMDPRVSRELGRQADYLPPSYSPALVHSTGTQLSGLGKEGDIPSHTLVR